MKSLLIILAAGLLFFAELVVHPNQVLYQDSSDFLTYHVPMKTFLVRSWQQTGELPLWCPESFAGMPFVHDIQVGAFYPLHFPLFFLPPECVGAALSWLVLIHVVIAGWCMDRYARYRGLHGAGALVAALSYMFAGKWMMHVFGGHYITIGLAWMPLVLLCFEKALARSSLLYATWAGAVFSLVILSAQPQWTLYAGLFLVLWTLGPVLADAATRRRQLLRWTGYGLWLVLIAVGLSAVQWLPTLEAAPHTTRGALSPGHAAFSLTDQISATLHRLPWLVGASLVSRNYEDRGNFGVLFAVVVIMAFVLGRKPERYQSGVCLLLVVLAVTGALEWLPGFNLLRKSMRLLLTLTLPASLLAGYATQALFARPAPAPEALRRCRLVLLLLLATALTLTASLASSLWTTDVSMHFEKYWLTLPFTVSIALWILRRREQNIESFRGIALEWIWVGILVVDLMFLARPFVEMRPPAEVYPVSSCVRYVQERANEHGRVLDREDPQGRTPLGKGAPMALMAGIESLRGYNPIDLLRYKEYLQFIMDEDKELRPFSHPLAYPVIGDIDIRNRSLLNLLGVRYLLWPMPAPADGNRVPGGDWRNVASDAQPVAYDFHIGGIQELPPYGVYQNTQVLPRAFVVPHAVPLAERSQVLAQLKATDFRREVLLENYAVPPRSSTTTLAAAAADRFASLDRYEPNRIEIAVAPGPAGFLILTDPWFPGWTCTVNGEETPIYRADFLFRAVELPAGECTVRFTFDPQTYRLGKWLSLATLAVVVGGSIMAAFPLVARRYRHGKGTKEIA